MSRTVNIAQTRAEMVQIVFPEHINVRGSLYGGRMMAWIATAGTLAASRLSRGMVVLGAMDDLDFLHPVLLSDIVTLDAVVTDVGRSSMEVDVVVHAEMPTTGQRHRTTTAHLAFVAVDEGGRPRPVGVRIVPEGDEEERMHALAKQRRERRSSRIAAHRRPPEEGDRPTRHFLEVCRIVFPEDAIAGNLMFAGSVMMDLDQVASIVALRYARGPVVTASVDALDFVHPIRVGEIVHYRAALNAVGRTSMEIGVRVLSENPLTGEIAHTCSTFVTMVHMDFEGRPQPLPPYEPQTPEERRRWEEASARRQVRAARLAAAR
ncbi:MAG: acyl-CoA thioesterase [Armatimonadota bacterium]|nr:acyl-CoA thioesterase [Armatimonadota bacterium]MDR5696947.1 acyl-CoA thioesterase [Armatimonadota bacterium]